MSYQDSCEICNQRSEDCECPPDFPYLGFSPEAVYGEPGRVMKRFTFKIKERGMRKKWTVEASIDVPENWDDMTADAQREYLIRPTGDSMHPGQILHHSSRFQKATGAEDVVDFSFEETS